MSILDECSLADGVSGTCVRARAYRLLFVQTEDDRAARRLERIIVLVIVMSTVALVGGSIPDLSPRVGQAFKVVEIAAATLFAIEYVARLWCITASCSYRRPIVGRLRYAITFFAVVDLVSIAPLVALVCGHSLELLAIARLARLLKLGRYSVGVRSLVAVCSDRRQELLAALGVLLTLVLIAATGVYVVEHEAQPDAFKSIPHSLWWSVVTMTTLGYGDVTPVTMLGRVLASIMLILGILILAIPTGIVSAGFYDEFRRRRQGRLRCPKCGEEFHDES